jgi:Fe-S oxidoreductase
MSEDASMQGKPKKCPFNQEECSSSCGLYIDPAELNETVKNKLASLGIVDRKKGICALKNTALCMSRYMFENASGYLK